MSSELSALGRELETTRLRLEASERRERALESSRRELVAFMSHDLRTPLAGLRALAEGLEDGVLEPEPALRQMRQTVGRLDGLVGDLFELSRVSSPDPRPRDDAALVSLVEVAHDVVGELQQHAQQRQVDLHLQVAGDDDRLAVTGNGDELTRLLGNLVGNAVRHTAAGGSVVVRAERCADGRTQVSVLDECGGIAEPDLPRVFEAGWRADPERSGRDAGAGLGLAIAKGIAESHAGSISVANVDGGCRFDVALPPATLGSPGRRAAGRAHRQLKERPASPVAKRHAGPPAEVAGGPLARRGDVPHVAEPVGAGHLRRGPAGQRGQLRRQVADGVHHPRPHVVCRVAGSSRASAAANAWATSSTCTKSRR